jgi:nucleotide-binding universal stress UspA family protein
MPVLAAIDDSDRAASVLEEAQALADDLDESVHAIHVLDRSELVKVLEKDVEGQDLTENYEVQQVGENIVSRVTTGAADDVTVTVRVGDPAEEISDYAGEADARYVVIGGRQRSPTGKALFGSVTQQVMFQSPVPVLNVALD